MAKTIEITDQMRSALDKFGADSKVFRLRGDIHRDFKGTANGVPYVMVPLNGGSALTTWYGPKVLAALQAEQATTPAN